MTSIGENSNDSGFLIVMRPEETDMVFLKS